VPDWPGQPLGARSSGPAGYSDVNSAAVKTARTRQQSPARQCETVVLELVICLPVITMQSGVVNHLGDAQMLILMGSVVGMSRSSPSLVLGYWLAVGWRLADRDALFV
jgi:hypothetical protein